MWGAFGRGRTLRLQTVRAGAAPPGARAAEAYAPYDDIPLNQKLPPEIDAAFPDYSIYTECDYAIGYLTRGCPNHCPWCVVPEKEGGIKPYREWKQVVRPDTNKLVLMDNNILASEYGVSQLESMIGSGYAIDLNQGMDARLVNDRIAGHTGAADVDSIHSVFVRPDTAD